MTPLLAPLLLGLAGADVVRLGDDGFRVGRHIDDAVLSPDGRHFAVAAGAGVFLLDATTGHVAAHWDEDAPPHKIAFDHAGRVLVYAADRVRRLEPRTGRVREWAVGPVTPHGEFHGGGRVFVAARSFEVDRLRQAEKTLFLDLETARPLEWGEDLWVDQGWALSPDGRRLAVVRNPAGPVYGESRVPGRAELDRLPRLLRVLDPATGRELYRRRLDQDRVEAFAFAPDGRTLVACLDFPRVLVLDPDAGSVREVALEARPGDRDFDTACVVSPGAKRLASVDIASPATVREWDLATGKRLVHRDGLGPGSRCCRIGYTPAGRLLAWNTQGCRLDVIDPRHAPILPPTGHTRPLRSVAFTPDGRQVVSTDLYGEERRWNLPDTAEPDLPANAPSGGCGQDYAPPDPQLPIPTYNAVEHAPRGFTFTIPQLPPPDELWPGSRRDDAEPIPSPDGGLVAAVLYVLGDGASPPERFALGIYPMRGDRRPSLIELPARPDDWAAAFAPDGGFLLVGLGGRVTRYETASGRQQRLVETGAKRIAPLAVSPDGRLLLAWTWIDAGDEPAELRLIELATGSTRRAWPWPRCRRPEARPCFSPDGRTIALPLDDATIRLLPTESAAPAPAEADLWDALASSDAAVAGAAVRALADRPDADEWARERPVDAEDRPVADWFAELDHDDFDRREAARVALARRPDLARRLVVAATSPSPHLRQLLSDLSEDRLDPPSPDDLRRERIREAMDRLAPRPARRPPP